MVDLGHRILREAVLLLQHGQACSCRRNLGPLQNSSKKVDHDTSRERHGGCHNSRVCNCYCRTRPFKVGTQLVHSWCNPVRSVAAFFQSFSDCVRLSAYRVTALWLFLSAQQVCSSQHCFCYWLSRRLARSFLF